MAAFPFGRFRFESPFANTILSTAGLGAPLPNEGERLGTLSEVLSSEQAASAVARVRNATCLSVVRRREVERERATN
jgi:hypothetical protein